MHPIQTRLNQRMRPVMAGALALIAAFTATPAHADGPAVTSTQLGLAVDLAGHRLTMPAPVWTVPSDEPVDQAQSFYRALDPGVDSLVLLPMGQTLVTWTRILGVLAVNQPGYRGETHVASIVEPMQAACVPDQLSATTFPAEEDDGVGAILLLCGRYKPSAAGVPNKCGGGIILATVLESPQGAAKIYHEWCTSSFNVDNRADWPLTPDELAAHAALLKAASSFVPLAPVAAPD